MAYCHLNEAPSTLVKCRIVFGEKIESIEYQPYVLRPIDSLKIIDIDSDLDYKYKYLDRSRLDHYFDQRGTADDMIMIQNGFVTDSYYGNLAFLKNGVWYTPERPLLKGTRRSSLLVENQIEAKQIKKEEISSYEAVRIFNAMIQFGQVEISMSSVL